MIPSVVAAQSARSSASQKASCSDSQADILSTRAMPVSANANPNALTKLEVIQKMKEEIRMKEAALVAREEFKKKEIKRRKEKARLEKEAEKELAQKQVQMKKDDIKRRREEALLEEEAGKELAQKQVQMKKDEIKRRREDARLEEEARQRAAEVAEAQAKAVEDLALAMERLKYIQDIQKNLQEDPKFNIDDETVCSKRSTFSFSSRRSTGTFRSLGKKLKKPKRRGNNGPALHLPLTSSTTTKSILIFAPVLEEERESNTAIVSKSIMNIAPVLEEERETNMTSVSHLRDMPIQEVGAVEDARDDDVSRLSKSDEVPFLDGVSFITTKLEELGSLADDMIEDAMATFDIEHEEDSTSEGLSFFSEYSNMDDNVECDVNCNVPIDEVRTWLKHRILGIDTDPQEVAVFEIE